MSEDTACLGLYSFAKGKITNKFEFVSFVHCLLQESYNSIFTASNA